MKDNFNIIVSIAAIVVIFLTVENHAFGWENDGNNVRHISFVGDVQAQQGQNDTTLPLINITYPSYPPALITGKIIIRGTASDSGSGIKNVSAVANTFPFNGSFTVPLASEPILVSNNSRSQWSVPLIMNDTGTYRVVVEATDNAGNRNYAETTISATLAENNSTLARKEIIPNIAFVRPTFTEAAYQRNGFYGFYSKYGFPPSGKNITTDLDMLTVKTPRSVSEFVNESALGHMSNTTALIPVNGTELNNFLIPQKFWMPFIDHVKKVAPNATLTVIRDEDVHDGHIFYPDNKTNVFDVLIMFHNEYVTQQEYDNLRQFVKNGGTIVFIDPNIFYAEVRYDKNNDTITLVKGHDWKFDGKAASGSAPERWYNETKEWVGSNFLINDIRQNTIFTNNLFNYTHFEEQFVNNPKAKILIDYGIKFPSDYVERYLKSNRFSIDHRLGITVATYVLDFGKGKVIFLGLYGQKLAENQRFMKFFDDVVLAKALCPKFQSCYLS